MNYAEKAGVGGGITHSQLSLSRPTLTRVHGCLQRLALVGPKQALRGKFLPSSLTKMVGAIAREV
jgi:hypothetical protein